MRYALRPGKVVGVGEYDLLVRLRASLDRGESHTQLLHCPRAWLDEVVLGTPVLATLEGGVVVAVNQMSRLN